MIDFFKSFFGFIFQKQKDEVPKMEGKIENVEEFDKEIESLKKRGRPKKLVLLMILGSSLLANDLFSAEKTLTKVLVTADASDYKSLYDKEKEKNIELEESLNKAIDILEQIRKAVPLVDRLENGKVHFTIYKIKYSIGFPNPSNTTLKDLTISLGYTSPSFNDILNFNFKDSRILATVGYDFFGFFIFSRYDFVNQFQFGIDLNIIKFMNVIGVLK